MKATKAKNDHLSKTRGIRRKGTRGKRRVKFKPFVTDLAIVAIIKVERAEMCLDRDQAYYVSVDCDALDSQGHIYDLHLSIYY